MIVRPFEVFVNDRESVFRPHIADGVAALIRRSVLGVCWSRSSIFVRYCRERLERVAARNNALIHEKPAPIYEL